MRDNNSDKLRSLIEKSIEKNKNVISDEPMLICNLEDVSNKDILKEKKLYIANKRIYYCQSGSDTHEMTISIFGNACIKAFSKITGEIYNFYPKYIPILNLYQGGMIQKKEPDFLLSLEKNNLGPPYPIVGEVAFSHESLSQLLYELINSISVFTAVHYAVGIKISYESLIFSLEIIVLERTSEKNPKKIDSLRNLIESEDLHSAECFQRPDSINIDDINPNDLGCRAVFHYLVTEENLNNDIEIGLNQKCITGQDGPFKVIIKSYKLKEIRDEWHKHKRSLEKK